MTIEFGGIEDVDVPAVGPVVGNEFAQVSVRFDVDGNAPRLRLEDLRSGRVRYLASGGAPHRPARPVAQPLAW